MSRRTAGILIVVLLGLLLFVTVYYLPLFIGDPGPYEETTVSVYDRNGTLLSTVEVRIADDRVQRYVGLSETDSLADDSGMLFVHGSEGTQSYVMRNMSFDLDIIFIDSDGKITTIHHAPADSEDSFRGQGQYVLEVPRGWANATGVDTGDIVEIPDEDS